MHTNNIKGGWPLFPRRQGHMVRYNCKAEDQVNLYHSPDFNHSERGPTKDHFEVKLDSAVS